MGYFQKRKYIKQVRNGNEDSVIMDLKSESIDQRCDVIEALGESRAEFVVDLLTSLLVDRSFEIRFAAASSLGKIGNPKAALPLIASLDNEAIYPFLSDSENESVVEGRGPHVKTVNEIARALIKIGEPATKALSDALTTNCVRNRGVAASVLWQVGTKDALPDLKNAFDNEKDSSLRAVILLVIDKISGSSLYDSFISDASIIERSLAEDLIKGMSNGSYEGLDKIDKGITADSIADFVKKQLSDRE